MLITFSGAPRAVFARGVLLLFAFLFFPISSYRLLITDYSPLSAFCPRVPHGPSLHVGFFFVFVAAFPGILPCIPPCIPPSHHREHTVIPNPVAPFAFVAPGRLP